MRRIYTAIMYCLFPFVLLRLLWKSRRLIAYRQRISERLAWTPLQPVDVWVHAVSLGEVVAVTPLIDRLLEQNLRVLVTTMTPTGSQQVLNRFKSKVSHQYIPYDLPIFLKRFFKQSQPKLGMIMETELWPNMIEEAHLAKVSLVLVNARLSDNAYPYYAFLRRFFAPFIARFAWIGAQSELDAERYLHLGASSSQVRVLGNMKFDLSLPSTAKPELDALKTAWGAKRQVWLAASTHDDEEMQLLTQLKRVRSEIPDLLLMIAPRRPERFEEVYQRVVAQGWKTGLRSQPDTIHADTEVLVLDSMGELMHFYRLSDYAFVGASLVPIGGHNVLEPIAMGVPVFCGPFMQNAQSICDELLKHQALKQGNSAEAIADELIALHQDPKKRLQQIENATAVLEANRGTIERYYKEILCTARLN